MVNEMVSVLSENSVLWTAPVVRNKSEISEPVLLSAHLYKVKDKGVLDPKEYILTPTYLHYANIESPEIIRGSLRLSWTFIRFLEGQPSSKLEEAGLLRSKFRPATGSISKRERDTNEEVNYSRQNSSPQQPGQGSPKKDLANTRDATLIRTILKASVLRTSGVKPKTQMSVDPTLSASVQNKFQMFRFEQGVMFTEIGTYIPDVAREFQRRGVSPRVHADE
jgi:hypothetical protein